MESALLTSLCALLLTLGLTSCPETKVPRDFGGEPLKIVREDWEGVWRAAGSSDDVKFVVKDAAGGQLTLLLKDKEKKSTSKTQTEMEVLLHEAGGDGSKLAFMSLLDQGYSIGGSLLLVTLPDNGVFHFWSLRHEAVEAAVKSGELSGKLIPVAAEGDQKAHNHTELASDKANYEKLMDPKFWEWTKPTTMVHVPKK